MKFDEIEIKSYSKCHLIDFYCNIQMYSIDFSPKIVSEMKELHKSEHYGNNFCYRFVQLYDHQSSDFLWSAIPASFCGTACKADRQ